MSRVFAYLLVILAISGLIFTFQPVKAAGDYWVKREPIPITATYVQAASVNDEIYVIGPDFTYVYNPQSDTWVSKLAQPVVRYGFGVTAYNGLIYVIGGYTAVDADNGYPTEFTGANQVYDPSTNTWTTKNSMPTARANFQLDVVDQKIYAIGGRNGLLKVGEVYDPSKDSLSTIADARIGVYGYASASLDGKIYLIGGITFQGPATSYRLNQIYDVKNNSWSFGESLPTEPGGVIGGAAVVTTGTLAERIYVIGGHIGGGLSLNTTYVYDPQANNWTQGASMPTSRSDFGLALVNNAIYAIGGIVITPETNYNKVLTAATEEYFPLDYQKPNPTSPSPTTASSLTSTPTPISTPPDTTAIPLSTFITEITAVIIVVLVVAIAVFLYMRHQKRG